MSLVALATGQPFVFPAGATTLIVSLGLIATIPKLGVLMLGVLLLVAQGFAINRLAGIDYPLWAPRTDPR